jgi:hypothetical protein
MPLFVCINFSGSNLLLAVQISVLWSVGPVGTVCLILRLVGGLKVGNWIELVREKWGKSFLFVLELYK